MQRGECSWLPYTCNAAKHVTLYLYLATSTREDGGGGRMMRQNYHCSSEPSKPDQQRQHHFGKLPSTPNRSNRICLCSHETFLQPQHCCSDLWPPSILEKLPVNKGAESFIATEISIQKIRYCRSLHKCSCIILLKVKLKSYKNISINHFAYLMFFLPACAFVPKVCVSNFTIAWKIC